jgi:beta-barrel assembly-enhancing protease
VKIILRFLAVIILVSGCRSKDGDLNLFSVEQDISMGKQVKGMISADPRQFPVLEQDRYYFAYRFLNEMVQQILGSDAILHRDDFDWNIYIIMNDSIKNAFCTPGGYIYVYTGLLRYLNSSDELAGVLGHEIAHADLRHSTEQLTKNYGLQLLIKVFFGEAGVLGDAAGSLLSLSFSRSDEAEADRQSVRYLMDTSFDPRGVARFFEKMSADKSGRSIEFLSTHPDPENRVEAIYAKWKELGSKTGSTDIARYELLKESLPDQPL